MANETPPSVEGESSGGGKKTLFIMIGVGFLMMGLGIGVGVGIGGMLSGGDAAAAMAAGDEEVTVEKEQHSIYLNIGELLAAVEHEGATRYIQAEVDLSSYDKEVINRASHEMPAIRNRLLTLFSSQDFDVVRTIEGREQLRADSVVAVNEVLGFVDKKSKIENAYFTAFVTQ